METKHMIRKADERDLEQLSALFDLYRQFYGRASDLPLAHGFLQERLRAGESVIFIAQNEDGVLTGFAQLYPTFSSVSASRAWILNDLYIREDYRRQGIASLLLEQVQVFSSGSECAWVSLQTARDNVKAQELYKKHGFVEDAYFCGFSYSPR